MTAANDDGAGETPDPNRLATGLDAILADPRETLEVELKSWLNLADKNDCARLARASIAMANHGGGVVLIGLRELPDGRCAAAPDPPATLAGMSQETIARILAAYVEPAFQPTVLHAQSIVGPVVAVLIPGGHRTPIQAKKGGPDPKILVVGRVYIRRPGPESAEPATAAEWREVIDRCVRAGRADLLDAIRGVLDGAVQRPAEPGRRDRLVGFMDDGMGRWWGAIPKTPAGAQLAPRGYYAVGYRMDPPPEALTLSELRRVLDASTVRHTGWSPWWVPTRDEIRPNVVDGALQCTLLEAPNDYLDDPAHTDFWRVTPRGEALLIRGFDEDGVPDKVTPGTVIDLTLPVWRIGECLLQAASFAAHLGVADTELSFMVRWSGLETRALKSVEGRRSVSDRRVSKTNSFERDLQVRASAIPDQLPELLHGLLAPFYELFDLYELSKSLVDEEVRRLRNGRF